MAPAIHPPCTPSASCQAPRCHPTLPQCEDPERCLRNTLARNVPPCASAVSIMSTRRKVRCGGCCKFHDYTRREMNEYDDARRVEHIENYLRRKQYEARLKREDDLTGSHRLLDYTRKLGKPRDPEACCAGHGHRGRLKKTRKPLKSRQKKRQKDPTCREPKRRCCQCCGNCTIL